MEKRLIINIIRAMRFHKADTVLINFWGTELQLNDLYDFTEGFESENLSYIINDCSDEKLLELMDQYPDGLPETWFEDYKGATAIVDIIDKPIGMPPIGVAKEKLLILGKILSDLFGFMSKHEKMIQITMPSEANAAMAGCDFETYRERMITALDVDYESLNEECERKVSQLRGNKRVIKTGKNCLLTMETTGREWNIDAGEGAFPCGEIYIAPVEEATNGTIFFDKLNLDGEESFENVVLTIKNGHLVDSNCKDVIEFIQSIPEEGADVVAELGIGMNPKVEKVGADATLEEDALGTFHIAFGMNVMFGGKNACRFHMDFVTEGEIE